MILYLMRIRLQKKKKVKRCVSGARKSIIRNRFDPKCLRYGTINNTRCCLHGNHGTCLFLNTKKKKKLNLNLYFGHDRPNMVKYDVYAIIQIIVVTLYT